MDVLITQKKMTDSEAFVKARGGGNLIGKAMYGGGKITMKQLYLQSFEVVFDAYFKPCGALFHPQGPDGRQLAEDLHDRRGYALHRELS